MPNATILVVEDHIDTLHLYETYLSLEGFSVIAVNNAVEAIGLGNGVDAIATDWAMPGMDGAEFIRRVRLARPKAPVPIVVVTGQANSRAETELFDGGACRVLHKPCDLATLADLLRWLTATCVRDCGACPNRSVPGREAGLD